MAPRDNILGVRKPGRDDKAGVSATRISQARIIIPPRPSGYKRSTYRTVPTAEEQKVKDEEKAKKAALLEERLKRLIVAIDLGTTYSGISYGVKTKSASDVEIITNWGSGATSDMLEKVPSVIAYAEENNFDEDRWGYDVEAGMVSCRWFKLLLDKSTASTDFDDPLLAKSIGDGLFRLPDGKSAKDVAGDYLRCLYRHTLQSLKGMMGAAAVDNTPIVFQLTLPATWSPEARSSTLEAAVDAGFDSRQRDSIVLVDEPEAAAIATLRLTVASFGTEFQPFGKNTCVTVVDMGGGTTDCITYRIISLDPLQLEEACIGEGGKCGGTTIDRNFYQFVRKRFGTAFTSLPQAKTTIGSSMFQRFEEYKQRFRGCHAENRTYRISLTMKVDPGDEHLKALYDKDEREFSFTSKDMESFFEPVIEKAFRLVRQQIKRTRSASMPSIKTIVLAGGLGSSPYIKYRMEQYVKEYMKEKAEVVTPRRPWSAVCRGACIRALGKPPVHLRKARDSIAMSVHVPWDDDQHNSDEDEKFECPVTGELRAGKQMVSIITRGEKIRPNTRRRQGFYAPIERIERSRAIRIRQDIFMSSDDLPSTRLDGSWEKCGTIKLDFTEIVKGENKKRKLNNSEAIQSEADIPVEVLMFPGSEKGIMEVQGKVGLKRVGDARIDWFADPDATKVSY